MNSVEQLGAKVSSILPRMKMIATLEQNFFLKKAI